MTNSAPNPFNPEALRLKSAFTGNAGVKKLLTRVPTRKPSKQEWFQVHPDPAYRIDLGVIHYDEDDSTYAVSQELQAELADLMVPMTFYATITRQGTVLLWGVRLPSEDGRNHDAWTSAHEAADHATKTWTRLQWNSSLGSYEMFQATGIIPGPTWPEATFEELLRIAFQGKIVDTVDHLVIKKLRGEA